MLEKLLLAITLTFSLHLFMGAASHEVPVSQVQPDAPVQIASRLLLSK